MARVAQRYQFLENASKCQHVFNPDYSDGGSCGTPYCSWDEYRCTKCKAYIVSCKCNSTEDISGWPVKRWKTFWKKGEKAHG